MLKKTKQFKSILDLPGVDGDKTIAFAIMVQNSLHPKNSQRVECVKEGNYKIIKNHE